MTAHKCAGGLKKKLNPQSVSHNLKGHTWIYQIIFTKSLETGKLPSKWLDANISPVYKKGDRSLPSNYRPISLTCVLCKVMEHIVTSQLVKHFNNHNILYELQHGFREKRSCETQLIMLTHELLQNMQKGKQTDLILLDFSKAFDKVSHEKLIYKLHNYGVKGKTLTWIKSFLDNRSQTVVVDGKQSRTAPVTSGVPQGSVLGPILFLAYINDLPDNITSQVRLFADDTVVYAAISRMDDSLALQRDLDTLQTWENKWDIWSSTPASVRSSKSPERGSQYRRHTIYIIRSWRSQTVPGTSVWIYLITLALTTTSTAYATLQTKLLAF